MSTQFHGREPDADVEPFSPSIVARHEPSYAHPEAPTATRRCAAGCREIVEGDARVCLDCAELIVDVADAREDHASSCDCLGCAAWSTATIALGGTALVWARKAVA